MKRFGIIVLVLCLLSSTACAEMVAEQVNAPEHITLESFQTDSGISTFTIDAQVQIPMVDSLNTYGYRTLLVTEDLLRSVTDALGLTDMPLSPFTDVPKDQTSVSYRKANSLNMWNDHCVGGSNSYFDSQNCFGVLTYDDIAQNCSTGVIMWLWPCEGVTAPDTDYPFADATALALQAVKQFTPDMTLVQSGMYASHKQLTAAEINKLNDPHYKGDKPEARRYDAYGYLFARMVDGVAVTHDENTSLCAPYTAGLDHITYERLALVVKDGRIVSLQYWAPGEVGAVKSANVKLLPFGQVLAIAKPALVQKHIVKENSYLKEGETISYPIDSIVLGYMRVRTKENPNAFELIPVWDFFGRTIYNPDSNGWIRPSLLFRESLLTINAMDGTVIDRENGY